MADNPTNVTAFIHTATEQAITKLPTKRTLVRVVRDPILLLSGGIVVAFVLLGLLAPLIAPYPYEQQSLLDSFEPPLTSGHLLGTDHLGRDLLSRALFGIRTSLFVGGIVTAVSLLLGMAIGLSAGYYRGQLDYLLSSLMDIAWGFPVVLVAVIVVAILGPGITPIVIGMSIVNWAGFGRIIRSEVLSLREKEFIEAARVIGLNDWQIILGHILPNTLTPTIVMASFYMGIVIIAEAGLSFIGLGAQPPLPSLGQMVEEGRNYLFQDIWMTVVPGVVLAIAVLAFNQLGDALRDLLDPRLQV